MLVKYQLMCCSIALPDGPQVMTIINETEGDTWYVYMLDGMMFDEACLLILLVSLYTITGHGMMFTGSLAGQTECCCCFGRGRQLLHCSSEWHAAT